MLEIVPHILAHDRRLCIRPLAPADAEAIAMLLQKQPRQYARRFYALPHDEASIAAILSAARQDVYFAMFWNDQLISVAMLRGWDEGYDIPSFGILVDEKFKGVQVMPILLETAKLMCRMSKVKRMMLKIHPDNASIRTINRFGFRHTSTEDGTGNHIYHMDL